ncbi:zinc-dependent alcohol dehydrogenase [Halostella litorea]|uniref:zinc-dependent alcohol dehydrogenase n=1 Tax=Halostella litorea TaxID=2528831 RepID=UPI00109264D8|nr:alcohol dehydrogenase catalytic domain-containing protein [Halostella litorea]
MKAIVQTGPKEVEVQRRETPEPGETEVLIDVHSAGLCGSDAHAYGYEGGYEWIAIPRIMGHEYAGTVAAVGDGVSRFSVGDHVVEEPVHDCGDCFQCRNGQPNVCADFSITGMHRDGAYAEYTTVDEEFVHRVPDSVPLRAAALTEPTSVATRAVLTQSSVTPGDDVLVEGPGPIGVLVAMVADSLGANVLVSGVGRDTAYRLPLVEDLGLPTVNAAAEGAGDRMDAFTDGRGFDVVFDTTGHHTGLEEAVEHVRKGGEVVVVGLPGEPSEMYVTPVVRGEIRVETSYGSRWRNFEQAIRLMDNGSIDPTAMADRSFDADEPTAAFEAFLASETCKPVFSFD